MSTQDNMIFEKLQQSIIDNVLTPAEAGRFITTGYQRLRKDVEHINQNAQVTVYFSEAEVVKGASQAYGDVTFDAVYLIELAVATAANIDIATLNDDDATLAAKATALRQVQEASAVADKEMNKLMRIVFQILMDNRNQQLGLVPPADRPNLRLISNRVVSQLRKDTPSPGGEYVLLTGSMRLNCRICETVTGMDLPDTPPAGAVFDNTIDLYGDDTEKTGIEVTTQ